jgi:hypothetical protein
MSKSLKIPLRIVVTIKDISNLTGRKKGSARNMYLAIMKAYRKKPGQLITYMEFCAYTGLAEELVLKYLN